MSNAINCSGVKDAGISPYLVSAIRLILKSGEMEKENKIRTLIRAS